MERKTPKYKAMEKSQLQTIYQTEDPVPCIIPLRKHRDTLSSATPMCNILLLSNQTIVFLKHRLQSGNTLQQQLTSTPGELLQHSTKNCVGYQLIDSCKDTLKHTLAHTASHTYAYKHTHTHTHTYS